MADRYYSVVVGEHITSSKVTEGSSTSSESIELRAEFDVSGGMSKEDLLYGIDAIKALIIKGKWPPA